MLNRRHTLAAIAAALEGPGHAQAAQAAPALLELRNYRTQPGERDRLIEMFEAHFLDAYQLAGAAILGTFQNLNDPDRWVWIRAFSSAEARAAALNGFYTSSVWQRRRNRANATIRDVSDALLLRRIAGGEAIASVPESGAPQSASVIECTRYFPRSPDAAAHVRAAIAESGLDLPSLGGRPLLTLESDGAPNLYPRLPVREDLAVISMRSFSSVRAHAASIAARTEDPTWKAWEVSLERHVVRPVERLRLRPTSRSALR